MIYAISAVGTEHVKFGIAAQPMRRLANLQIGCPIELKIIACGNWPDTEEPLIHLYLDAFHVRGEWFNRCPAVERVIGLLRDGEIGYREWLRVRQAHHGDGNAKSVVRRLGRAMLWRTT